MKTVLLIHEADEERTQLEELLGPLKWELRTAGTLSEARTRLQKDRAPVVIYDRDLPGPSWQDAIRELHRICRGCVVLLSRVSDEYLFREVVHCGGFDVLAKPLQKAPVESLMKFAVTHLGSKHTA